MQTFPVTFSRNPVIVLLLVLVPLTVTAVFMVPLLMIRDLPEWLIFLIIGVIMVTSIRLLLLLLKKWGSIAAEVQIGEEGIEIKLLQCSPFYTRKEYHSAWEGLANVSSNYDPQHTKRFYSLTLRHPHITVSLQPAESVADSDTETAFGAALIDGVGRYNAAHAAVPQAQIRQRGFYDAWWAKGLTGLAYLSMAGVVLGYFVNREVFGLWRVVQVLCFSALWLAAYYANRRHTRAAS